MRTLSLILGLVFFTQSSYAATGLKEALDQYHYNITVEWDQQNADQLNSFEEELKSNIEELIQKGHSPEALMNEAVSLLKDEALKEDLSEILSKRDSVSKEELTSLLQQKADSMHAKGASWNAVTKIILGVVIGYVVLKALMLTIYFWDTEPVDCTTQDCSPPPKPE